MKKDQINPINIILAIMVLFAALFINGCASNKQDAKNDFFDEWRTKAEASQPYLPKREEFRDTEKSQASQTETESPAISAEKATNTNDDLMSRLPTQNISVRFVNEQLPTVLRTLARLADQNILLSPSVQGAINTQITNTPWNKVFMSIVQNYNLVATKEDNLLHVMSMSDMREKITRQSLKIEQAQLSPLVTNVVAVEYAEPADIAASLNLLLSKDASGGARGSVSVGDHSRSLIIRDTADNMNTLMKLIYDLDKPIPQVLIQAHIIETTKDTARELGVLWGGTTNNKFGDYSYTVSGDFVGAGGLLTVEGTGIGVTLDLQLSALQTAGKINILSSPSIATLDNKKATISSGTTIPVQSGKDENGNAVYTQQNADLLLSVKPNVISGDRVKLEIEATKDEVGAVVGGNQTILTKSAKTVLIVEDKATVVIAGLTKEKSSNQDEGIPLLMDLPGIGGFFKNNNKTSGFEDLLIFITPTILSK